MDSAMERLDLEPQQVKAPQVQTQPVGAHESENHAAEGCEPAALAATAPDAEASQVPEPEARTSLEAEAHAAKGQDAEAYAAEEHVWETPLDHFSSDEAETQLAAIRELMAQARARGIWLSLEEIAQATEFGEASISAQLRHLRKAHHGRHRVEKRRRGRSHEGTVMGTVRDARRKPIIWEYRVLPHV
jgi:hypothetical protein